MKSLHGGIDIGSESHHVIIMDGTGKVLYDWKITHRFGDFREAIGDIGRFDRESQLAVYCGVACIDDDSGKSKKTKAVYKANKYANQR